MTNEEAIKYLIPPITTSTEPSAEYLKQKEAYELAIKALQNERPKGEWKHIFEEDNDVECPFCGFQEDGIYYNFCPNCGADMRRGNNKETTFDDYLKEQLKDPEFKKEYEKASMDIIDFNKMTEEIEEVANKYGLTVDFGKGTIGQEVQITLELRKKE